MGQYAVHSLCGKEMLLNKKYPQPIEQDIKICSNGLGVFDVLEYVSVLKGTYFFCRVP